NLKEDSSPAYQLRRYAWSCKLPLSILTDFEEMAVYDCLVRPRKNDKASAARITYFTYTDYVDRWPDIESVFSREAVLRGSFDKYAETTRGKRGTSDVDSEFLKEIENWRDTLAGAMAMRNSSLSVRELNFAVQKTIDRIIFLRMCEDRGIEQYGQLQALCAGPRIYPRLLEIYNRADEKYNSGLFHFQEERGRPGAPDTLTPKLKIDDSVLKGILINLYYPESPYEFSILPPEILGNVYEQFLGKVIRLTKGHRAKVEEKPEVRKAGGVYYTPQYIVDYIVANTVGKLCEGKTPRQISALRILDPACGSGSFLLGAYRLLIDYHLKWYLAEMEKTGKVPVAPLECDNSLSLSEPGINSRKSKAAINRRTPKYPAIFQGRGTAAAGASGGDWLLTTREKKRILLNNIFGVDIDTQAVEVTKLSLLLKVLENENSETIRTQLTLWRERALPDLSDNIRCGNSLIGPDFYDKGQMSLDFDEEERYRINAFDWRDEKHGFGHIMKASGFDCVIGNPPYIRIQAMKEWAPVEVEHYKKAYRSASKGHYDIYVVFVEKGLSLLNKNGRLGFILPHKFFNSKYGEPLRSIIAEGKHLSEVVHFGDRQVFSGATTYTCLMFLDGGGSEQCRFLKVGDLAEWRSAGAAVEGNIEAGRITANEWNFIIGKSEVLHIKLREVPLMLRDVSHLFVGLQTDADDVFIVEEIKRVGKRVLCYSKNADKEYWFEEKHLKPLLKGSLSVHRYYISNINKRLIFPYETISGKSVLISETDCKKLFPLTWKYLEDNQKRLKSRDKERMGTEWHGYLHKQNHTRFESPKLVVPSIATGSCFSSDLDGKYYFVGSGGGGGGGYGITIKQDFNMSYLYLLGILNSALINLYIKETSTPFRGGYIALNRQYIEQIPIRPIDFSKKEDVERHDRMVELVEEMLGLHKKLPAAKTPDERSRIERRIAATDGRIDSLVYELYELTDKEIKIVEARE
ncbi:MAG: Eco57I restriction-modification methylase domain-containing protein, partial [bacterium]